MTYLMDTHIWIWWHVAPEKLSARVRETVAGLGRADRLALSVISVWEVAKLAEKNRLRFGIGIDAWVRQALDMSRLRLFPLSPEVSIESTRLPSPFHSDPADQIIVASARQFDATILTADRLILAYPHVRAVW